MCLLRSHSYNHVDFQLLCVLKMLNLDLVTRASHLHNWLDFNHLRIVDIHKDIFSVISVAINSFMGGYGIAEVVNLLYDIENW